MNPLDVYLSQVAHELRSLPLSKRDEELKELRSHLEQRVEDFEHGLNLNEAQQQATAALGSPKLLGSRLADAWEGIPFSWWRVAATCGVTTLIWIVSTFIVGISMALGGSFSETALFPELFPLLMALYLSVPVFCGALFSHWLGRRGRLFALIDFTLVFVVFDLNLHFNTTAPFAAASPPTFFVNYVNSSWAALLQVALGFFGAYFLHALKQRKRLHLAEASGFVFSPPPVRLLRIPFNPKTWFYGTAFYALILLIGGTRVWLTLHPSTPTAALRYRLVTGNISDGFEAPRFVEFQELPPTTPAELVGRERRVRFELQISAKPYFRTNQLVHLNRQATLYKGDKETHEAIARVKANRQVVKGVARLVRTDKGWRVDESSFDSSQLHAWFYAH